MNIQSLSVPGYLIFLVDPAFPKLGFGYNDVKVTEDENGVKLDFECSILTREYDELEIMDPEQLEVMSDEIIMRFFRENGMAELAVFENPEDAN